MQSSSDPSTFQAFGNQEISLSQIYFISSSQSEKESKAHCRCVDWINNTIKKKRIRQTSLYSGIHADDNDLIPFILETKYDLRA